jgi:O-antigen ligase
MTARRSTSRKNLHIVLYVYIIGVLGLFFSVADQALGHLGLLPASPTLLCVILLSPFLVGRLVQHCVEPQTPGPLRVIIENSSVLLPFAVVALTAIFLSLLPGTYWHEGGKWVLLLPYGLCITCCATLLGRCHLLTTILPWAILVSLGLLAGSIWYDSLHPGTFAPITNRAAGFPGNANFAALVAVMLCAGGLQLPPPPNRPLQTIRINASHPLSGVRAAAINLALLITTFAIVCMTMSRSGLINFSVLMVLFLFYRLVRSTLSTKQRTLDLLSLILAALVAVGFALEFSRASSATNTNSRLSRFLKNQQVDDGSAGTRLMAVREAITLIESSPFVGHGTGFARTMSELPHNIYLQQWVNNGLLGILTYAVFLASALLTFLHRGSRNGVALITVAAVGGIFSHNILDQRPFLILLGLLLGLSREDPRARGISWSLARRRISATPIHALSPALEGQGTGL